MRASTGGASVPSAALYISSATIASSPNGTAAELLKGMRFLQLFRPQANERALLARPSSRMALPSFSLKRARRSIRRRQMPRFEKVENDCRSAAFFISKMSSPGQRQVTVKHDQIRKLICDNRNFDLIGSRGLTFEIRTPASVPST
jgi:hypothetical protein